LSTLRGNRASEVGHALLLGLVTFGRVVALVVVATVIWVPVGVWIGMNPRVARLAQPVVQVLASFPANFLFPLVTAMLVATGDQPELGRDPADGPGRPVVHPVQATTPTPTRAAIRSTRNARPNTSRHS
jgi:hypothetical protein